MGYQDRDYYREEGADEGFQIKSWTVRLIIINVAVFLANALTMSNGRSWLVPLLDLQGNAVADPKMWYQFLTYGFLHNPESLWHVAGNMLGLWVFGRSLEEKYGSKEFLRFYFIAIVLGGIVWSLRQYFLIGQIGGEWATCKGASGGITALIIVFCLLYPH